MEYVLFLGMKKVGSMYPNIEEAKKAINGKGVWYVCGIVPVDGKLRIANRESIIVRK
jgi:hypothetical protein